MKSEALKKMDRMNISVVAVVSVASLFVFSLEFALGVMAGSALMMVNFFVLHRLIQWMWFGRKAQALFGSMLLFLKLLIFFAITALCLLYFKLSAWGFGVGATLIIASIIATGARYRYSLQSG